MYNFSAVIFESDTHSLQVRDEPGRKRLHGAFTGGFSASKDFSTPPLQRVYTALKSARGYTQPQLKHLIYRL
jgi:hypothetical protein